MIPVFGLERICDAIYYPCMKITVLTLFPEYFTSPFSTSIIKRAQAFGHVDIHIVNIRDFAEDAHRTTDDRPFGGGAGMVMLVAPIAKALAAVQPAWPSPNSKRILLSAKGETYTQKKARDLAVVEDLVLLCGHYEGVDERVAEYLVDEEISIGEYVLTGGEAAAAVIVDSVTRLLPGVLGNPESLAHESHDQPGFRASPQYSQPRSFNGWDVPDVLLSGNHKAIEAWKTEKRVKG